MSNTMLDVTRYSRDAEKTIDDAILAFQRSKNLLGNIIKASSIIIESIDKGGKLLILGNGGSAADASHLAAELVGRFRRKRVPLPAIALNTDTSLLTAISNDFNFSDIFVRQLEALARPNDIVLAISTSGNSANVLRAINECKKRSIATIGLTGGTGGELAKIVDLPIVAPAEPTSTIQEVHRVIIHIICDIIDDHYE